MVACLGQEEELQREPDQGEVEATVAHHRAGDAEGEQQDDGGHPAPRGPERTGVGRADHQAQAAEHIAYTAYAALPHTRNSAARAISDPHSSVTQRRCDSV